MIDHDSAARRGTGADLWRLSGRARDQRGHGGGGAAAGSRRDAPCDHPPDRRARSGAGARPRTSAPGSRPASRPSSSRSTGEMKAADVVVCRAGATTLAELAASGRAGDSGAAADGDRRPPAQERRGRRAAGAAVVIEERELTGERSPMRCWRWSADADGARAMAARGARRWRGRMRRRGSPIACEQLARAGRCTVAMLGKTRRDALRRRRRDRHERHRRAAGESRLRGVADRTRSDRR